MEYFTCVKLIVIPAKSNKIEYKIKEIENVKFLDETACKKRAEYYQNLEGKNPTYLWVSLPNESIEELIKIEKTKVEGINK